MKKYTSSPAFPLPRPTDETTPHIGLTKREYFAAMAIGPLAAQWGHGHQTHACEIAIAYADELLKQLEQ